jgi:hypothetical protein
MTATHVLDSPPAQMTAPDFTGRQIKLFAIRAAEMFDRVLTGKMLMCDAADILYEASIASGLESAIRTDQVQKLMAAAFASASASRDRGWR